MNKVHLPASVLLVCFCLSAFLNSAVGLSIEIKGNDPLTNPGNDPYLFGPYVDKNSLIVNNGTLSIKGSTDSAYLKIPGKVFAIVDLSPFTAVAPANAGNKGVTETLTFSGVFNLAVPLPPVVNLQVSLTCGRN